MTKEVEAVISVIRTKLSEMSDPLCESLICRYLVKIGSEIAEEFKVRFRPSETSLDLEAVWRAFTWENLVRATVYNHLEMTAPRTARLFRKRFSFVAVSHSFGRFVEILRQAWARTKDQTCSGVIGGRKRNTHKVVELNPSLGIEAGGKFTTTKTIQEDERIRKVPAGERITRSGGNSVSSGRKLGVRPQRFSPEEDGRIREALREGRHYAELAAELGRIPNSVCTRMRRLKSDPRTSSKKRTFSAEEDRAILDRILPRLARQPLASSGFLTERDRLELGTEFHRNPTCVGLRWEGSLQVWLLQHYAGTGGLSIERMLANCVAELFPSYDRVDWGMIAQKKEFAGHTAVSLKRLVYGKLVPNAKKKLGRLGEGVTPQVIAEYASTVYGVGRDKGERKGNGRSRQQIVEYFETRVGQMELTGFVEERQL